MDWRVDAMMSFYDKLILHQVRPAHPRSGPRDIAGPIASPRDQDRQSRDATRWRRYVMAESACTPQYCALLYGVPRGRSLNH